MASYRKKGNGWVAEISRMGVRKSRSFATKAQAIAWATKEEAEILSGKRGTPDKPLSWLLEKYGDEVSPKKRGHRWERIRMMAISKMPIGNIPLSLLSSSDFARWRDDRLKEVSPATINRDWNLLSNVMTVAINEWKYLSENPLKTVKRPPASRPRDRLITNDEIERLLLALGYDEHSHLDAAMPRVGAAFLFAIETAMRAGEIISLTWDDVDLKKRVARLSQTKNGTSRDVPLSSEAIRILEQLQKVEADTVFGLTSANLDALFRKAKSRALIEGLHFHDTRHEAITRLAKKLDVLELARMVGHRDLKMLMIYYNETAEALAKKLD